ncbi:hypothetical protein INT46_004656 [Mucor plumbeus]|uniref:Tc1-like transposase DDE domain-containing protein n=1 Tax=Mucor plumbeus TaxID=97098 RepID=A0A8H7QS39_9FUNG|nr:hypothetical protein INT46_004656 [Mucor plumbeus]
MTKALPIDTQNSLKLLLQQNTPYSQIMKQLPNVSKGTISNYKQKLFKVVKPTHPGRTPKVTKNTQQYIANTSQNVSMTNDGVKKMLRRKGFKARRKVKTNMISKDNQKLRLAWAKAHRHLSISDWRKWIFSDETRVNMWGSDGVSYYWSDKPGTMQPHQITPKVQNNGGGVMFWGCITSEGPGYGTTILEGTIDWLEYKPADVRFQQDKASPHRSVVTKHWFNENGFSAERVLDWPAQSPDLNPIEHVWTELKRRLDSYPTRPTAKEELATRISDEWNKFTKDNCLAYIDSMPKRIKAVIRSKGGSAPF